MQWNAVNAANAGSSPREEGLLGVQLDRADNDNSMLSHLCDEIEAQADRLLGPQPPQPPQPATPLKGSLSSSGTGMIAVLADHADRREVLLRRLAEVLARIGQV